MDDLIRRIDAIHALTESSDYIADALERLEKVPKVEGVYGHWRAYSVPHWTKRYDDNGDPEYKYHNEYTCSICRRRTIIKENYCPNCGARMDGEAHEH